MSKEKKEKFPKQGRPPEDVFPKTPLAKRLWLLFSGHTFEEIAKIADATGKTARSWLEGKTEPTISQLELLAKWKRVPLAWILSPPEEYGASYSERGNGEEITSLPSSGIATTMSRGGKVFLKKHELDGIKLGAFDVVGNDMVPCAKDGQRVLVDPASKPKDGKCAICLFSVDDVPMCLFRRVIYLENDLVRLEVTSTTSSVPPITVQANRLTAMRIVGVLF